MRINLVSLSFSFQFGFVFIHSHSFDLHLLLMLPLLFSFGVIGLIRYHPLHIIGKEVQLVTSGPQNATAVVIIPSEEGVTHGRFPLIQKVTH